MLFCRQVSCCLYSSSLHGCSARSTRLCLNNQLWHAMFLLDPTLCMIMRSGCCCSMPGLPDHRGQLAYCTGCNVPEWQLPFCYLPWHSCNSIVHLQLNEGASIGCYVRHAAQAVIVSVVVFSTALHCDLGLFTEGHTSTHGRIRVSKSCICPLGMLFEHPDC